MSSAIEGRAWAFGDNIDTDLLAPGAYLKGGVEAMAEHCLEAVEPRFAKEVRPGDIVAGGKMFGMGSSREQAAAALVHLGVRAVVAVSFARIFYRNAMNLGLPALICPEAGDIETGDMVRVDPAAGTVENLTRGGRYACEPIPDHLLAMIEDGGLLPHLEKKLKGDAA